MSNFTVDALHDACSQLLQRCGYHCCLTMLPKGSSTSVVAKTIYRPF